MNARVPRPRALPPCMPHAGDHPGRALARMLLAARGWHLVGRFPDVPKLVLIVAPHTSWWDGFLGLLMKAGIGADVRFIGKAELFHGPMGWLLRHLGGIPVDRRAASGVVEQMIECFARRESLWLGLAPEGTRRPVTRWKTGFWHIARGAGVPILPVAFDYPTRAIQLGPLLRPSADRAADLALLRSWYAPWRGKHRGITLCDGPGLG